MIQIEAKVNGDSVDVHSDVQGRLVDFLGEATAIVESLYDNVSKHDEEAGTLFLALLGELVTGWMKDKIAEESPIPFPKGGGFYA